MDNFSLYKKTKQLGFHYYKDDGHFDEPSLDYWLPKLQAAGTRWLVTYISEDLEIPETFVTRLNNARIEPILVMELSISKPPTPFVFRQRMAYYRNIGIHMVQFFNQPNVRDSWDTDEWLKGGLVTRFVRKFAEYANICIQEKIIPIFPLLKPGGDYWDINFLQTALRMMKKEYGDSLLSNLIFSADAGLNKHTIEWNRGGSDQFPDTVPYQKDGPDHRGFFIFEWYEEVIRNELRRDAPMILMEAGRWSDEDGLFDKVTKESKLQYLKILNLVQEIRPRWNDDIPDYILSCCLYKLPSAATFFASASKSNLSDTEKTPSETPVKSPKSDFLTMIFKLVKNTFDFGISRIKNIIRLFGTNLATIFTYLGRILARNEKISDYFLLPEISDLFTEEQLAIVKQYIKLHKYESGTDLSKALTANNVILMQNKKMYPSYILHQLKDRGCAIRTINLQLSE